MNKKPLKEGADDPKGMPKLMSKRRINRKEAVQDNGSIFLCRHGATDLNDDGDKIRGWLEVPLNDKGIKEAQVMGKRLKGKIDVIVASDLVRTKQTAKEVSREAKAPIVGFSRALRPWNVGAFTGQPSGLVLPNLFQLIEDKPNEKIPGGESFDDFKTRFLKEMQIIKKGFKGKRVAVIAHHRNDRAYAAWNKLGEPDDFEVDIPTFTEKGIPPGDFKEYPIN